MRSLIWIAIAAASIFAGLAFKNKADLEKTQQEYDSIAALSSGTVQEIAKMKAKYDEFQSEFVPAVTLETKHQTSLAKIATEKKLIDELLVKWNAADADRESAVKAVRELEVTKPPATLVMAEGPPLTQFQLRSVPDEKTISVEHSSGLVKISADKLTAEYKKRLGLGWKPEPPPAMSIDRTGKAVLAADRKNAELDALDEELDKELKVDTEIDTLTMAGVASALASTDAKLAKANEAFRAERANIKKLAMFKQNMSAGGGRTFGEQSKAANQRLIKLAERVTLLQNQQTNLQSKLKTFAAGR